MGCAIDKQCERLSSRSLLWVLVEDCMCESSPIQCPDKVEQLAKILNQKLLNEGMVTTRETDIWKMSMGAYVYQKIPSHMCNAIGVVIGGAMLSGKY